MRDSFWAERRHGRHAVSLALEGAAFGSCRVSVQLRDVRLRPPPQRSRLLHESGQRRFGQGVGERRSTHNFHDLAAAKSRALAGRHLIEQSCQLVHQEFGAATGAGLLLLAFGAIHRIAELAQEKSQSAKRSNTCRRGCSDCVGARRSFGTPNGRRLVTDAYSPTRTHTAS
jgi:hypothetical protein